MQCGTHHTGARRFMLLTAYYHFAQTLVMLVRHLNPRSKALSLERAPHAAPNRVEPKRPAVR